MRRRRGPRRGALPLCWVSEPREGADFDPAPAPDGTWLAFASTRDSPEPQVYRRALEGGALRRLASGPGARVQPAVSRDGPTIACAGEPPSSWGIMVLRAEGGREVNLTSTPDLDEIHPTWSPSGEALAFSGRDPARFFPFAARLVASRAPVRGGGPLAARP